MQPRLMRIAQAAQYCGCSVNHFRLKIAPAVQGQTWLFETGLVYDRFDLDKFIEEKKQEELAKVEITSKNGLDSKRSSKKGMDIWPQNTLQGSLTEKESGTLISNTEAAKFAKALTLATGKKQKRS